MSNRTLGVRKHLFELNCITILNFSVLLSDIKIKNAPSESRINKGENEKTPLSFELRGFGFQWCFHMVRMTGVEPARGYHRNLKPARLPIPPHPHIKGFKSSLFFVFCRPFGGCSYILHFFAFFCKRFTALFANFFTSWESSWEILS